jgi:hypothetical protein
MGLHDLRHLGRRLSFVREYADPNDPESDLNVGHDLVVRTSGTGPDRSLIHSQLHNVVFDHALPLPPQPYFAQPYPTGDPLRSCPPLYPLAPDVYVSDSAVFAPQVSDPQAPRPGALTIGSVPSLTSGLHEGRVSVVQWWFYASQEHEFHLISPGEGDHCIPTDIVLSRDTRFAVVRSDTLHNDWNILNRADIVIFDLTATPIPLIKFQIGASGRVFAVDSVEMGRDRIVSISQNDVNVTTGTGWVQIVNL